MKVDKVFQQQKRRMVLVFLFEYNVADSPGRLCGVAENPIPRFISEFSFALGTSGLVRKSSPRGAHQDHAATRIATADLRRFRRGEPLS